MMNKWSSQDCVQ